MVLQPGTAGQDQSLFLIERLFVDKIIPFADSKNPAMSGLRVEGRTSWLEH